MSDSMASQGQNPADDQTIEKAEEANRLAAEHGVADPGGLPGPANAEGEPPVDRPTGSLPADGDDADEPLDQKIDDVTEEMGPPQ
ncbi:hypothetical protein [Microbacterium sp. JZ31]|uniref:hypothetical protein n=1 Tax=Microbacterium sp. JZ31 TaxID=1906274 RepID=UPI001931F2DE|nr:hypothetical protein [Microbacterium sp. JZ31]